MDDKLLPNCAINPAYRVAIQAIKFVNDEGVIKFQPLVAFFLDQEKIDPLVTSIYVDKLYDSSTMLAMETTIWANLMWDKVDASVLVIDREDFSIIQKHDVKTLLAIETATVEFSTLVRTDTTKIH